MADKETVNHPSHYNAGSIEVIDAIEDWGWGVGFCAGNAIKYIARHQHKGMPVEDLQKARWYLDRLIERHKNALRVEPIEVADSKPHTGSKRRDQW
jgi:hypothetical protein